MKIRLLYIVLAISFVFLTSGSVVAACMGNSNAVDWNILWLWPSMTFLFLSAVVIDVKYAIPRLLLTQKYFSYCIAILVTSYTASVAGLSIEYFIRLALDMPSRYDDLHSAEFYVSAFSNSVLLMLILLGVGVGMLYKEWAREAKTEKELADKLSDYIHAIKNLLNPVFIKGSLQSVYVCLNNDPAKAVSKIQMLSAYLRRQLYEMPVPPVDMLNEGINTDYSSLTNFFVSRKYRWVRHLIFQCVLLLVSADTFFTAPEQAEFANKIEGCLSMYVFLNILTYVSVLWLGKRFRRRKVLKRYMIETGIFLCVIVFPVVLMSVVGGSQSPVPDAVKLFALTVSTIGTIVTLFFFIGGITAIILYQDWIIGKRRVMLLHAETVRQEYAFLKKQINPHFLFNVLNNIGILSVDEPEEAAAMLSGLQKLVEYQFAETDSNTTTISREVDFLNSYLSMESTRIDSFNFEVTSDVGDGDTLIPTLLFIPFVENAVKYSSVVNGRRFVEVSFRMSGNGLEFRCANTFRPRKTASVRSGGLGIPNTLRRLNLLFGDNYVYTHDIMSDQYIMSLTIPCRNVVRT